MATSGAWDGWSLRERDLPPLRSVARAPELGELRENPVYRALIRARFARGGSAPRESTAGWPRGGLLGLPPGVLGDLALTPLSSRDLAVGAWGFRLRVLRVLRPCFLAVAVLCLIAASAGMLFTGRWAPLALILLSQLGYGCGAISFPEGVALEMIHGETLRAAGRSEREKWHPLRRPFHALPGVIRTAAWFFALFGAGYGAFVLLLSVPDLYQRIPLEIPPNRMRPVACGSVFALGMTLGRARGRHLISRRGGLLSELVRTLDLWRTSGEEGSGPGQPERRN